jgi:hypothetical protein
MERRERRRKSQEILEEKRPFRSLIHSWEDNIKMVPDEIACGLDATELTI